MRDMLKIVAAHDSIDRQKWDDFINGNPNGNIFQSPAMYDFLMKIDKYCPVALAALNEQNEIRGILLGVIQKEHKGVLGKFSSRAVVWGGPLVSGNHEIEDAAGHLLRSFVKELKRRSVYIEFRNIFDTKDARNAFEINGFIYKEHLNFIVSTATKQIVEQKLGANRRRQIKKSFKKGTRIIEAENLEQVGEFYRMLMKLYKGKVHKPLPDWAFFENFYRSGIKLGVILLVISESKVIGGIMCPVFQDISVYEWYVCGLDEEYPDQYPSVMATWAAIEFAQKNGFKYFDFMGAGPPDQDYGVREFKARFGGELVSFGRYFKVNNRLLYATGKLGLKILGKIGRT